MSDCLVLGILLWTMWTSVRQMWRHSLERLLRRKEKVSPVWELVMNMSGSCCGAVSECGGRLSSSDHSHFMVLLGPLLPSACCVMIRSSSENIMCH